MGTKKFKTKMSYHLVPTSSDGLKKPNAEQMDDFLPKLMSRQPNLHKKLKEIFNGHGDVDLLCKTMFAYTYNKDVLSTTYIENFLGDIKSNLVSLNMQSPPSDLLCPNVSFVHIGTKTGLKTLFRGTPNSGGQLDISIDDDGVNRLGFVMDSKYTEMVGNDIFDNIKERNMILGKLPDDVIKEAIHACFGVFSFGIFCDSDNADFTKNVFEFVVPSPPTMFGKPFHTAHFISSAGHGNVKTNLKLGVKIDGWENTIVEGASNATKNLIVDTNSKESVSVIGGVVNDDNQIGITINATAKPKKIEYTRVSNISTSVPWIKINGECDEFVLSTINQFRQNKNETTSRTQKDFGVEIVPPMTSKISIVPSTIEMIDVGGQVSMHLLTSMWSNLIRGVYEVNKGRVDVTIKEPLMPNLVAEDISRGVLNNGWASLNGNEVFVKSGFTIENKTPNMVQTGYNESTKSIDLFIIPSDPKDETSLSESIVNSIGFAMSAETQGDVEKIVFRRTSGFVYHTDTNVQTIKIIKNMILNFYSIFSSSGKSVKVALSYPTLLMALIKKIKKG